MELFIGILGMLLIYYLGQILYPDVPPHKTSQIEEE